MRVGKWRLVVLYMVALLLLGGCAVGQGSGNLVQEARAVSGFDRVELSGSGSLAITPGRETSLIVETDDNMMQYVSTTVRDGTLYLGLTADKFSFVAPTTLRFSLEVPVLTGLALNGSGMIIAETLAAGRFEIASDGSGDIVVKQLAADEATIDVTGSGWVQVAGDTERVTIHNDGSGDVDAGDLRSQQAEARVTGSSHITVWAIDALDASVSGSGAVEYYGKPAVQEAVTGSGVVNPLGEK